MRRLILPDRRQRLKTDRTIRRSIPTATKTAAPTLKYQARSTCTRRSTLAKARKVVQDDSDDQPAHFVDAHAR